MSAWQGEIDWRAVRADGIEFSWIKATDGAAGVDQRFAENWSGALFAGLSRGAYHFMRAGSGRAQAEHFLRVYPGGGELSVALDMERADDTGEVPDVLEALLWIDIVTEETGARPMVYTSPSFAVAQHLEEHPALARCDLWVAHWHPERGDPLISPTVPRPWSTWRAWQTGKGLVAGLNGMVDLDLMQA